MVTMSRAHDTFQAGSPPQRVAMSHDRIEDCNVG